MRRTAAHLAPASGSSARRRSRQHEGACRLSYHVQTEAGGMQLEDYFDFLAPGDIRIRGTRIGIETILDDHLNGGDAPEVIARRYPALTLEQVNATIGYHSANPDQVQRYFDEWVAHGDRIEEELDREPPPI